MKRLHVFIIRSFIGPLVATFFVSIFILLMQFLWKYIDDLAGKGLEWMVIGEFIIYGSARLVPMALPLAILLSSIMTFGNLGENFELTAVKSAGVSLQRFMSPLIVIAITISFGAFYYSDYIIPYTNLKIYALIYDVKNQRPELQIKEGAFYNGIEGYSIKIAKKEYKTNLLKNIMIYDHKDNPENNKITLADSGYMKMTDNEKSLILTLYNGYTYEEIKETKRRQNPKSFPHQRQKFDKQVVIFELTGFDFNRTDEELFKNNYNMYNLKQLEVAEDTLTREYHLEISNFSESLKLNNYFKNEPLLNRSLNKDEVLAQNDIVPEIVNRKNRRARQGAVIDTIPNTDKLPEIMPRKLNIDSVYSAQAYTGKEEILSYALGYARSAQNSISNSMIQFKYSSETIRRHQIEWHRKFTLSFACLVFFFIGAPFGAIVRKGGFGTPVVISILFFIAYYMLSISGEKFVREDVLPAYLGMWLSSIILMPLGAFLTYKATTDSVILNSDTYVLFFKKIFQRFEKKA